MMDKKRNRILYLLDRCMLEKLTSGERQELNAYLDDDCCDSIVQEGLLDAFYKEKPLVDMPEEQQEQILRAIYSLPKVKPRTVQLLNYGRWGVAIAVAMLLIGFFTLPEFFKSGASHQQQKRKDLIGSKIDSLIEDKNVVAEIDHIPARDQAILTLSDGEVLVLDKIEVGTTLSRKDFSLTKLEAGKVEFSFHRNDRTDRKRDLNRINTLVTPRGGIYNVILADGTRVYLNASSRLTFPSYFSGNQRLVQLEGEAYFDVAKDENRQFIVRSGEGQHEQEVLVYGTKFNISAYHGDNEFTTTLVEGSVKLHQVNGLDEKVLKPMEQVTSGIGGIALEHANLDVNLAWMNKLFYFANHDIEQVMKQISRWYDVDFTFVGDPVSSTFWGQIARDKMLSEVLEILAQTNNMKFTIKGKEVLVMKK